MEAATARETSVAARARAYTVALFDQASGLDASALVLPGAETAASLWGHGLPTFEALMRHKVRGKAGPEGVEALTSREQELLGLVASGLSRSQIADQLVVSARTVETALNSVLQKLERERVEPERRSERDWSPLHLSHVRSIEPSELWLAILWAIGSDDPGWRRELTVRGPLPMPPRIESASNRDAAISFAEHICFAPIMPVEASPISGQPLATVLTGLSATSGTAALVAADADPLLAVQAGIGIGACVIIVGTARAVSDGMSFRIRRWFGMPDPEGGTEPGEPSSEGQDP